MTSAASTAVVVDDDYADFAAWYRQRWEDERSYPRLPMRSQTGRQLFTYWIALLIALFIVPVHWPGWALLAIVGLGIFGGVLLHMLDSELLDVEGRAKHELEGTPGARPGDPLTRHDQRLRSSPLFGFATKVMQRFLERRELALQRELIVEKRRREKAAYEREIVGVVPS